MTEVRRALILAGGGLKVAYQAGALQVWLDEAGLGMDLAVGSSGGTLNLAMWCQGYSGRQIADAWRNYRPLRAATVNPRLALHGPFAPSLLTQRGLHRSVLPSFGLDWHAIRTSQRDASFDIFNFSNQEHQVVDPAHLTEDLLLSASALPWWFPPVRSGSDVYIDAVFATDANLEEAIRRGANELWVVWTVSTKGAWRNGFVHGYFQMIEAMANAGLRASLRRIEDSNARIDRGEPGAYPHRVCVKVLAAEVPLHYLIAFRRDRFARVVDLGAHDARRWCAERGIPTVPASAPPRDRAASRVSVTFRERMSGRLHVADLPCPSTSAMTLDLGIGIDDLELFRADPKHTAAVHGVVICPALGGRLPIRSGTFHVLTEHQIGDLRMIYTLRVGAPAGRLLRIRGEKFVCHNTPLELWRDTTTLYLNVYEDDVELAAGVLRLSVAGFVRELSSMRGRALSGGSGLKAVGSFVDFFLGRLTLARSTPAVPRSAPCWLSRSAP